MRSWMQGLVCLALASTTEGPVLWLVRSAGLIAVGALGIAACAEFDGGPFPEDSVPRPRIEGLNALVIVLDDVGVDKVGVYAEHPDPPSTPAIDALAREGARFTNAYAYPTCSPSRAALMTGQPPRTVGIDNNIRTHEVEVELPRSAATIPEMLRQGGYTSAGIGKWHLSARDSQSVDDPLGHGFDHYAGALGNLRSYESYSDYAWELEDGTVVQRSEFLTTAEVDAAIAHVRTLPEPWFVYLSLHAPHYPWDPPPTHLAQVRAPYGEADLYDANLEAADTELRRLLAEVDLDTTFVILVGDNGTPDEAVRPPADPLHAKNTVYEGGINVPLIVAGGPAPRGVAIDRLVSIQDIFPTLASCAGLDPWGRVDGQSLWVELLGRKQLRATAYSEKFLGSHHPGTWRALRDERYKIIRSGDNRVEFFDLQDRTDDGPNLLEGRMTEELWRQFDRLDDWLGARVRHYDERSESGGCG